MPPKPIAPHFRALRMIEIVGDCWVFTGCKSTSGYGKVSITRFTSDYAHRVVYEGVVGPIPAGLTIDHLCRNRLCVNPVHLEVVTMRENCRRGMSPTAIAWRKNECMRGHAFTDENTYVTKRGWRHCRACARQRRKR